MTTEIAYHTIPAIDQNLVLKGLQDMALQDKADTQGLWRLAKAALAAVRALQNDLGAAQAELIDSKRRIADLEALVTTDELTKLANRRGFMDVFDREIDRVNRGQTVGGLVIMIDMDNFKVINDTYGHGAGDEALKLVGQTLSAHIRKMDVAARLGGDEFALLFANAERVASVDRAQKLARKLNTLTLKYQGHRIAIRASLGIQPYCKGDRVESIMNRADERMYEAKKESRK